MYAHQAQICISCAIPMRIAAHHAASDPSKEYCRNCGRENGELKSYEEVLRNFVAWIKHIQGLPDDAAHIVATHMLSTYPAWRDP
jgi:hypothetical protein